MVPQSPQQLSHNAVSDPPVFNPALHSLDDDDAGLDTVDGIKPISNIRQQLKLWNDLHGSDQTTDFAEADEPSDSAELVNNSTRLGDVDNFKRPFETEENERDDMAQVAAAGDQLDDFDPQHRFLRKGDLVELDSPNSDRESTIAIFVRKVGTSPPQSQFYTIHGKWIHMADRKVQFAIPGWIDVDAIDPIIPYLPDTEVTEELHERAQMFDLSVPRYVSAPLVSRMLQFQRESDDLYRRHARTLDDAHNILAHPTDLKFGSIEQIVTKLLGKRSMSPPALFTVRKALMRAGFAFDTDRRSHRLTGFIQIRSKSQVATVEKVRNWIREWQDDLATLSAGGRKSALFRGGSGHVQDFIDKARGLIEHSRKTRPPTSSGRVAPGETRFEITKEQESVKYTHTVDFSDSDRELIRFMEGWACSNLFRGLPRVEALPPLLLHATGMYDDHALVSMNGFMFLQEIGVLMPYENRVRFDQHLLLPSSQHSKPGEFDDRPHENG